jgi:hypothetical protein
MINGYLSESSEDMEYLYLSDIDKYTLQKGGEKLDTEKVPTGGFPPIFEITQKTNNHNKKISRETISVGVSIMDILNAKK